MARNRMSKKAALLALAAVGSAALCGGFSSLRVTAKAENFDVADFEMISGASARYSVTAQTEQERYADSGIRFHATLPTSVYEALEGLEAGSTQENVINVSYGMLIMPYSYVAQTGELNAATVFGQGGDRVYGWAGDMQNGLTQILNITYDKLAVSETVADSHEIKGSITRLLPTNYSKEFVARAYVKYEHDGKVEYDFADYENGDARNSARSAAHIAQLAEDKGLDCASWLRSNYLDKVTSEETTYTLETYVGETLVKTEVVEGVTIDQQVTIVPATYDGFEFLEGETTAKVYANGKLTVKHVYRELEESEFHIVNGGFENDLTGWTLAGEIGDVSTQKNYWLNDSLNANGFPFGLDGEKMFSAYARDGLEGNFGTLQSSPFTVTQNGWITYKLGGAKNADQVHLEVVEAATGKILRRYHNTKHYFGEVEGVRLGCELNAFKANLSEFAGKEVYIRVSDKATGDFGLFFLDSVKTVYMSEPTGEFTLAEDQAHPETVFEMLNGTFEADMLGWRRDGGAIGWISDAATYWENPVRQFENVGKYFSCYAPDQREGDTGTLVSTVFTVGGSGWITFSLGGVKDPNYIYMEIVNAVTGEVIGKYNNEYMRDCTLVKYKADLSDYLGKQVFIRFVDNSQRNYGLIFCDEFITYYPELKDVPNYYEAKNLLYTVANGSFETASGDGWGWYAESGSIGGTNTGNVYWEGDERMQDQNGATLEFFHKDDNSFYMTDDGGTGVMRSSTFTLAGDGIITFKLGGNKEGCRVEVVLENGTVIATVVNNEYNDPVLAQGMLRRFVNASKYIGQRMFIRVVDEKAGGIGMLTIDAVEASLTMEEAQAILAADKAIYENYRPDVVEGEKNTLALDIVELLRNYYSALTIPTESL